MGKPIRAVEYELIFDYWVPYEKKGVRGFLGLVVAYNHIYKRKEGFFKFTKIPDYKIVLYHGKRIDNQLVLILIDLFQWYQKYMEEVYPIKENVSNENSSEG